jgi:hypothetical protein
MYEEKYGRNPVRVDKNLMEKAIHQVLGTKTIGGIPSHWMKDVKSRK